MRILVFLWFFFASYLAYAGVGDEVSSVISTSIVYVVLVYIAIMSTFATFFLFRLIKYAITDKSTYYINRNNYNKPQ